MVEANNTAIFERIAKILSVEGSAIAACVAIAGGQTPDPRGFDRASRIGYADYNRWDGYSLTRNGREIVRFAVCS